MQKITNIEPILSKKNTDIYGLDFYPTLEPYISDDRDACINGELRLCFGRPLSQIDYCNIKNTITERDYNKVVEIVKSFNRDIFILEIGVSREAPRNFTEAFLKNKTLKSVYLGIDIEDKSFLNDRDKNIYTLKTDSRNQDYIRENIKKLSDKIDILMIDGWHSVNCAINDWKYSDLLSDDGAIIIHDTNGHPGPLCLLEAINKEKFIIDNLFILCDDDYGLAVIRQIRNENF